MKRNITLVIAIMLILLSGCGENIADSQLSQIKSSSTGEIESKEQGVEIPTYFRAILDSIDIDHTLCLPAAEQFGRPLNKDSSGFELDTEGAADSEGRFTISYLKTENGMELENITIDLSEYTSEWPLMLHCADTIDEGKALLLVFTYSLDSTVPKDMEISPFVIVKIDIQNPETQEIKGYDKFQDTANWFRDMYRVNDMVYQVNDWPIYAPWELDLNTLDLRLCDEEYAAAQKIVEENSICSKYIEAGDRLTNFTAVHAEEDVLVYCGTLSAGNDMPIDCLCFVAYKGDEYQGAMVVEKGNFELLDQ